MRAAVMRNRELVVDHIDAPVPSAGEVLVKTLACGICGSDLHALKHAHTMNEMSDSAFKMDLSRDIVMGHEFCAEVLDFGPGTSKALKAGDRVCSVPITVRGGGSLSVGYSDLVPGGYSEQMVLFEPLLLKVPNGLSTDLAALTEPMAVGYHAVMKAGVQPGEVPLVIGCGPVGLAVILALKTLGIGPVVAADFSPARRKLAETVGADVVVDPAKSSPYEAWEHLASKDENGADIPPNPLTGGLTFRNGVYFECVGVPGVIDAMMKGAKRGCRIVVVGVCMEQDHILPLTGIGKELAMQFVLGYTPEEFAATLHNIAEGKLSVEPLITGRVGIEDVPQAFHDLADPEKHAKILVIP
ncbi:MAG: zinc-binding dehydrogenase [Pseudomonadales bacterium]|nr:zinc-binding dehydrogenase [Pseudomonadales bacterium]